MRVAPDVEQIMENFEAVLAAMPNIVPFGPPKTVSRVWIPFEDIGEHMQPAIIIVEQGEKETARRGQQPAIILKVLLVCYYQCDVLDKANPPNTRANNFVKSIREAFLPSGADLTRNAQTLGSLVSDVFIDGDIAKDSGVIDGQGSMAIPVSIQLT